MIMLKKAPMKGLSTKMDNKYVSVLPDLIGEILKHLETGKYDNKTLIWSE